MWKVLLGEYFDAIKAQFQMMKFSDIKYVLHLSYVKLGTEEMMFNTIAICETNAFIHFLNSRQIMVKVLKFQYCFDQVDWD